MTDPTGSNLKQETIDLLGLKPTERKINAQISPDARVFEYPKMENVYIMESDLYGNTMPEGSCFLVFIGRSGLIGKHITVETLLNSSVEDIRKLVADHDRG